MELPNEFTKTYVNEPFLPNNFVSYVPLITYYRQMNIDCLLSRTEQFRFYIGYIGKSKINAGRPAKDFWQDQEPGFSDLYYDCNQCIHSRGWNGVRNLSNEKDMMTELSKATQEQIQWYLTDLYPYNKLKEIVNEKDKQIVNITNTYNNNIIKLLYKPFKLYCNFYYTCFKQCEDIKNFQISLSFTENTARCIEDLINNKNVQSYKNATDLKEYMSITDYFDVSFT